MVKDELQFYFDRIDMGIPLSINLEVLTTICRHHIKTIPFENIDPFLGIPIHLDSQSIRQKMLVEKRGGYCFEHNLLMMDVLEELGFQVRGITGRPVNNYAKKDGATRTHMALLVSMNQHEYLVDVGFGSLAPIEPLLMADNKIQETSLGTYRILRKGNDDFLQIYIQGTWRTLYTFDLREQTMADFEVASWYISNHPSSYLVNNLMVSIVKEDCHYSLTNKKLTSFYLSSAKKERRLLTSPLEMQEALKNLFKLPIHEIDVLNEYIFDMFKTKTLTLNAQKK